MRISFFKNIIHHFFQIHGKIASWKKGSLLILRLRPTNQCQLSCPFCYVSKFPLKENLLDLNEWQKVIEHLPFFSVIDVTGGEPLIAPHIKEILKMIVRARKKITLTTNALALDEDFIHLLVDHKAYALLVSLDGPEMIHDTLRGAGSFKKTLENIEAFESYKRLRQSSYPKLVFKINILKENVFHLKNFYEWLLIKFPQADFTFNLLFNNEARGGRDLELDPKALRFHKGNDFSYEGDDSFIKATLQLYHFLQTKKKSSFLRPLIDGQDLLSYLNNPKKLSPKSCTLPWNSITMYGDGTLSPCDLSLSLGNVRQLDYKVSRVFATSSFDSFIKEFKKGAYLKSACQGCCLSEHKLS